MPDRSSLEALLTRVEMIRELAFEIPPPNEITPQIVQLCIDSREAIRALLAQPAEKIRSDMPV